MFNGHWIRNEHEKEPGGGMSITEQSYIRPNDQIAMLTRAGMRLKAWRMAANELEKEPEVDPTLVRGVDITDVAALAQTLKRKLRDALYHRDEEKKKVAAEAALALEEKKKAAVAASAALQAAKG